MARSKRDRSYTWRRLMGDERAQDALPFSRRVRRRRPRSVEISSPAVPGRINRWYPSQGEARAAALRYAVRFGEGCTVRKDRGHALGQQPHYHVVCPGNRRMDGHFFFGPRLPRKAPPDDSWSRRRRLPRTEPEADEFLSDIFDTVVAAAGQIPHVPSDIARTLATYAGYYANKYGDPVWQKVKRRALELKREYGPRLTVQNAIQMALQAFGLAPQLPKLPLIPPPYVPPKTPPPPHMRGRRTRR